MDDASDKTNDGAQVDSAALRKDYADLIDACHIQLPSRLQKLVDEKGLDLSMTDKPDLPCKLAIQREALSTLKDEALTASYEQDLERYRDSVAIYLYLADGARMPPPGDPQAGLDEGVVLDMDQASKSLIRFESVLASPADLLAEPLQAASVPSLQAPGAATVVYRGQNEYTALRLDTASGVLLVAFEDALLNGTCNYGYVMTVKEQSKWRYDLTRLDSIDWSAPTMDAFLATVQAGGTVEGTVTDTYVYDPHDGSPVKSRTGSCNVRFAYDSSTTRTVSVRTEWGGSSTREVGLLNSDSPQWDNGKEMVPVHYRAADWNKPR